LVLMEILLMYLYATPFLFPFSSFMFSYHLTTQHKSYHNTKFVCISSHSQQTSHNTKYTRFTTLNSQDSFPSYLIRIKQVKFHNTNHNSKNPGEEQQQHKEITRAGDEQIEIPHPPGASSMVWPTSRAHLQGRADS
jgi:hypothetical protein